MPCYSTIITVLIDLTAIEAAAKTLGITLTRRTPNSYTLKRGNEYINIERAREGDKFSTSPYSGSPKYESEILKPIVIAYARERVKQFAKKKGYTVSAGSKPGQLVLTKYS